MKRDPHWIDRVVGDRIRARRRERGLSQTDLGASVGITFQQIQKYENGVNRVSASRLYEISAVLEVTMGWFFEDLPAEPPAKRSARHGAIAARPRSARDR